MRKFIYLILSFTIFSDVAFAQIGCLFAGDSTLFHYTNLNPDTTISAYPQAACYLDIDQDGSLDYKLETFRYFHIGTTSRAYIEALGQNKFRVNFNNNTLPDTLSDFDSVCYDNEWSNSADLLYYASAPYPPVISNTIWNGLDKFIGLKLVHTTVMGIDSTLGWLRISASMNSSNKVNTIVIKSFGCGPIPPILASIGTIESSINKSVIIYPNPTSDIINIDLPNVKNFDIKIFNSLGEKVYHNLNILSVDLSNLKAGIYFLVIESATDVLKQTIIKSE